MTQAYLVDSGLLVVGGRDRHVRRDGHLVDSGDIERRAFGARNKEG